MKCCKVKEKAYKVHIGVCDTKKDYLQGLDTSNRKVEVIGYNSAPDKTVTPAEADSDEDSNEEEPGHDEGVCHVYKTYIGGQRACIPGNMVLAAKLIHEWQESDERLRGQKCSMNLGSDCTG